jgi:hypothetical protein
MKKLALLMAVASLFLVSPAVAKDVNVDDGNNLLKNCSSLIARIDAQQATSSNFALGQCLGFVTGADGLHTDLINFGLMSASYCKPESVTRAQLIRLVVKFLKENPGYLNMSGSSLVLMALKEAFPCPKPQPSK